jgi:hypothetical protein
MTPTITPGERVHHWQIIAVDGRRVTAQCRCGQVRIVALDELQSGVRTSCGCLPASAAHQRAVREAKADHERQRLRNWRLERGR